MSVNLEKKKKVGFNKPVGGDTVFQHGGVEISAKAVREKAMAAIAADESLMGQKVNSFDAYAKPEEGRIYYAGSATGGDFSGSTEL